MDGKKRVRNRDLRRIKNQYKWLYSYLVEYGLEIHHTIYHYDNCDVDWIYDLVFCDRDTHMMLHHEDNVKSGSLHGAENGKKTTSKKVIRYDTMEIYDSIREASRMTGADRSNLSKAIKNNTNCIGTKWGFYNE